MTTTTHKTLRGPRGGLILTNDPELAKAINRSVFPGSQGGPLMHIIAAKAVAFGEALKPGIQNLLRPDRQKRQGPRRALQQRGYRLVSGGTDNHLMLVDLRARNESLTGADAEKALEAAGIITNKNGIPNDPRPAKSHQRPPPRHARCHHARLERSRTWPPSPISSIAALVGKADPAALEKIRKEVAEFCKKFPMPH